MKNLFATLIALFTLNLMLFAADDHIVYAPKVGPAEGSTLFSFAAMRNIA